MYVCAPPHHLCRLFGPCVESYRLPVGRKQEVVRYDLRDLLHCFDFAQGRGLSAQLKVPSPESTVWPSAKKLVLWRANFLTHRRPYTDQAFASESNASWFKPPLHSPVKKRVHSTSKKAPKTGTMSMTKPLKH